MNLHYLMIGCHLVDYWKFMRILTRIILVGWYYNLLHIHRCIKHTTLKLILNFFESFLKMKQQSKLNPIKYVSHTYFINEWLNKCIVQLYVIFGRILRWSSIMVQIIAEFTTSIFKMYILPIRNFHITCHFVFYTHKHN